MYSKEKYILSLEDIWFYSPGTYKTSFCVKSKQLIIPINVKQENEFHDGAKKMFVMEPMEIAAKRTDPVQLHGTEILVDIDRGIFLYFAFKPFVFVFT